MRAGPCRIFLLLLLAVDWVGDPYHGASPLSAPLSSQEAVCDSLKQVVEVLRACDPWLEPAPTLFESLALAGESMHSTPERPRRRSTHGRGLVLLFLSIRC